MKITYFTHSLRSCWNHGNAHFLRGVLRELQDRGCEVRSLEPTDAWSYENLLADHGQAGLNAFTRAYPELHPETYDDAEEALAAAAAADVVLVHEWTPPEVVARLSRSRAAGARYLLLFHDTHHRAVSDPEALRAFDLAGFDGVLAFGEALAEVYRRWGWGERVFVWHEAADTRIFKPAPSPGPREGLVFIGNFGDAERTQELESYLLGPAADVGAPLDVYGVRYPEEGLNLLARHGALYRGWLPNPEAPRVFAAHKATVHVPRRFYREKLPGIPTIRVFEALACGVPLLCAPWEDREGLFRAGTDYLLAEDPSDMTRLLRDVLNDEALRGALARSGRETILERHTCGRRADELLEIIRGLTARGLARTPELEVSP